MKKEQKHTPKYWIAHSPQSNDVFLQTADKARIDCQRKTIELYNNEREFFNAIVEGSIELLLMEVKPVEWPDHRPLQNHDFQKIVPKPYLRLEATEDFRMNGEGEVAFKKGRAYLFAYTDRGSYVTVSEGENTPHFMYREDLEKYFKLLE